MFFVRTKYFSDLQILFFALLFEIITAGFYLLNPIFAFVPLLIFFSFISVYYGLLRGPAIWVYLMVFATGLDQAGVIAGGVTLFHISWFMGILTLIFHYLIYQDEIKIIFPFTKYFLFFVGLALLSLLYSPNSEAGLVVILQTIALYVFFMITANYIKEKKQFIAIIFVLLIVNIFETLLLIYQLLFENVTYFAESTIRSSSGMQIYRPSGTFEDPNVLAFCLIPSIIFSISLIIYWIKNKPLKLMLIVGIIISLIGTILTFSRSGWLALIAGLSVLLFYHSNKGKVLKWILFSTAILFIAIFSSEYGELISSRFSSIFDLVKDPSTAVRIGLVKSGFAMFMDNPILGVGYRGFPVLYDLYIDAIVPQSVLYVKESHTLWITLLSELGIGGVLIVLFWFMRIFDDVRMRYKNIRNEFDKAIIIGCIATFIAFNIEFILYGLFPQFNYIWLLFGLIYSSRFENSSMGFKQTVFNEK